MDDLFRFVLMRPPDRPDKDDVHVLAASFLTAGLGWESAKVAAEKAVQGGKVLDAGLDPPGAAAARSVVDLLRHGPLPASAVVKLVEGQTDQTPATIVESKRFAKAVAAVSDTLVALKLLSSSLGRDTADLTTIARGYDAIAQTAAGVDPVALRPLVLPTTSQRPKASTNATGKGEEQKPSPRAPQRPDPKQVEAEKRLVAVNRAIDTLQAVTVSDLEPARSEGAEPQKPSGRDAATRSTGALQAAAQRVAPISASVYVARPWMLSAAGVKALPNAVSATLRDVGTDPTAHSLPMMLDALHTEALAASELVKSSIVALLEPSDEFVGAPTSAVPAGHGAIQPAGIGDLLLVKEHTKAYEGGEIAHVENVLQTESLSRETRRLERTETTLMQESETTKEEERDTQTTERSSLSQESSKTIQSDSELKAGLSVDAKYGPFVEVKANAEFATKSSSQESTQQASEYSKDVVARSVSKIVERVRQQRTTTTLSEFEEKYSHGFDNTHGAGNISGVYQWLNEILEAQIYNYGKRMLFDVTLPEPATAVMLLQSSEKPTPLGITEPVPLTINASQITETNYTHYAALYDATGIEAPPAPVKSFSKPFANVQHSEPHEAAGAEPLAIDDGYAAQYALFQRDVMRYEKASCKVLIGSAWVNALGGEGYFEMQGETGTVPIAFDMYEVESYAITVEVFCQRTTHALEAWRLKTFTAIQEAYLAKQTAYRQALSAAQAEAATAAYGRSPGLNAEVINSELRKQCLTLVTGQEFEGFGALELSPEGYAEPNLTRTAQQMPYVRFFEQAFEWEHITYTLYPYFWGWKQAWSKRMLLDDSDPSFAAFLRAGAARVVFPVRPGFEEAVLHYLETGEIWSGGPPPTVNSELYVPIVKEIQEAQGAPSEEAPEGEPWPVVLPTTLVKLRPDNDLPEWKKVAEQWTPVN
jgi:hypothetical protein